MQRHEAKQHAAHGWQKEDTSHIKNVDYLVTHYLMRCSPECGFFGWVEFSRVD